jgi:hypothetical protein
MARVALLRPRAPIDCSDGVHGRARADEECLAVGAAPGQDAGALRDFDDADLFVPLVVDEYLPSGEVEITCGIYDDTGAATLV